MAASIVFRRFSLGFRSPGGTAWIFKDVDLEIPPGRFYLLRGPSGAGKSTLLDLLAGEFSSLDPSRVMQGSFRVLGPGGRKARVVTLFQQDGLWDDLSVVENVRLPARASAEDAVELLERLGIDPPPERVSSLSGGQRRRVALARAIAFRPDLLLLDEPAAGLDRAAEERVLREVSRAFTEREGALTVILCSHGVEAARRVVDGEILVPGDGRILLGPPGGELPPPGERPRSGKEESFFLLPFLAALARGGLGLVQVLGALPLESPLASIRQGGKRILQGLLFLVLAGFFLGALSLHFLLGSDPLHGALVSPLLAGAGKVLLAVVVPFLGAILYAAPAVAGTLARVGSMVRDRQLASYRALGRSVRAEFLSPLLWSHLIALPVLTIAMAAAGIYGAWFAGLLSKGISLESFLPRFLANLEGRDVAFGLVKALGSAFLLTWIPWQAASRKGLSPEDLDRASLRAWIFTALSVLFFQGLLLFPQIEG